MTELSGTRESRSAPLDERERVTAGYAAKMGLLAGILTGYVAVVGMVETFSGREIIAGSLTLGQVLLVLPVFGVTWLVARKAQQYNLPRTAVWGYAALVGAITTVPLIFLIILAESTNIREMFINISPALVDILTFTQGVFVGSLLLAAILIIVALLSATLVLLSPRWQRAIQLALLWTLGIGMFSELIILIIRPLVGSGFLRLFFRQGALTVAAAVAIFLFVLFLSHLWQTNKAGVYVHYQNLGRAKQKNLRRAILGLAILFLMFLPWIIGTYLSEVIDNVGLYILMGLGLNVAVGLAGLLDLGYVTNFAVGAYIAGVLTSTGALGRGDLSFWIVIPISLLAAMFTGFILALPVLRMRGDYLAIATLGFGEIIRILALSDWLAPYIGGPQGILDIPKPELFGFVFAGPQEFYYIILAACAVALFVFIRLNNSRTGRQWMALREDEDVAAAMGIDTTVSKLLAFTISAASGGLAGAIFAAKLGTIFPQSFSLLVSINVLSIIIIGGIGSIPGIILGSFLLIGTPELLREFAEYRLLLYGALLIVTMLLRPAGLWPSAARKRELESEMEEGGGPDITVPHSEMISHGQEFPSPGIDTEI